MTSDTMELHAERIAERAKAARPGPILVAILVGLAMAAGWVIAKLLGWGWYAVAWLASAFVEGWKTGWDSRPRVTAPPG